MYDKRSDYALNKLDPDAIVCKSVSGESICLTRADFASDAEFRAWKAWSDEDYHATEKDGRGYYDNCVPANEAIDTVGSSVEELLATTLDDGVSSRRKAELAIRIRTALTDKQYRRLYLYYIDGLTEAEIDKREGVGQRSISKSFRSGVTALENIFREIFGAMV